MGSDKALIEIDGRPLWQRQLELLEQLRPAEIFIAGPQRDLVGGPACTFLSDAKRGAGPLGGVVAALRRCSTPHLLALAVDLPPMTAAFLHDVAAAATDTAGIVPKRDNRYEPLAAVYPKRCLAAAEAALASGEYSLQKLCATGVADGWLVERTVTREDAPLFANLNTPGDVAALMMMHHA